MNNNFCTNYLSSFVLWNNNWVELPPFHKKKKNPSRYVKNSTQEFIITDIGLNGLFILFFMSD